MQVRKQELELEIEQQTGSIGKGVCQGCILSPCLFNFYAEYIVRNSGLEEAQAGIKIAGGNINNLKYANDTTLMAEREEEPEIKLPTSAGSWKKKESSRKASISVPKPLTVWITINCGKF